MVEDLTWYKQSGFSYHVGGKTIYIDPFDIPEAEATADAILVTHAHFDHFDPDSIDKLRADSTKIFAPADVAGKIQGAEAVKPGDEFDLFGIKVRSVPAYNLKPERLSFHPRENDWLGYILKTEPFGTLYHAGDTDLIPEMSGLEADVALLPIGGTYTMDPAEAAEAAKIIKPKRFAVPMHYGFVVGGREQAEEFAHAAGPVPVKILTPKIPFEK